MGHFKPPLRPEAGVRLAGREEAAVRPDGFLAIAGFHP
jgi:hypothetical protein